MISESPFRSAYLRALFFVHDAEIRQVSEQSETPKGHLWTGTNYKQWEEGFIDIHQFLTL